MANEENDQSMTSDEMDLDLGGQEISPGDWDSIGEPAPKEAAEEAKPAAPQETPLETVNPSGRGRYPDPSQATPEQLMQFFGVDSPEDALRRAYQERWDQFGRSMRAERQVESLQQRIAQQEQQLGQILNEINQRLTPEQYEPDPNENVTEWVDHRFGTISQQLQSLQERLERREQQEVEGRINEQINTTIASAAQADPSINEAFGAIAAAEIQAAIEDYGLTDNQAREYFIGLARQTLAQHHKQGGNVAAYIKRVAERQYGWRPSAIQADQNGGLNGAAAKVAAVKQKQAAASSLSRGGGGGGSNLDKVKERMDGMSDADWVRLREKKGTAIWDRLADDTFGR